MNLFLILTSVVLLLALFGIVRWVVGGWSTLRKLYPASSSIKGEDYLSLGVKVYRKAYFFPGRYQFMRVVLSKKGLWLQPYIPIFSRALLIPWNRISKLSPRLTTTDVSVQGFGGIISFTGYPTGEQLKKWVGELHAG